MKFNELLAELKVDKLELKYTLRKSNLIDGNIMDKLRMTTELSQKTWVSRRQLPHTDCAVPEDQRLIYDHWQ